MANKSSLNVSIDNGSGISLNIIADASGYLVIQLGDKSIKLEASDAQVLSSALSYANALRRQIPNS